MRNAATIALLLGLSGLALLGCGTADSDFEAGNRLKILRLADGSDSTAPVLLAVEKTDDSGKDGTPRTSDDGEGDGFPDPGETVEALLGPDLGVLTLGNEPRLGVTPGVDLQVYLVDVTYLDANGGSRTFAPTQRYNVALNVASGASGELGFVLVPEAMKKAAGGLRDLFLRGSEAERRAVQTMTAVVDVYARDVRNKDTVHAQGSIPLTFINPISSATP